MITRTSLAGAMLALALILPAHAEETDHSAHHGMAQDTPQETADQHPSTKAFIAANAKMHAGMDIDFTGNTDLDFVRGMIAHHEGAVDMARIQLEHGKDPALRKLAEEIIAAQEVEIAMMKDWLAKNAN